MSNSSWASHVCQLRINFRESDNEGDWYGVWIHDVDENIEDFPGSMRFPRAVANRAGIRDKGARAHQTFTELYHKKDVKAPIPTWHVSIKEIFVEDSIRPRYADSEYGEVDHTDMYLDEEAQEIHLLMGPKVSREHEAGRLFGT